MSKIDTEHLEMQKRIVLAIVNDTTAPQYVRDSYKDNELADIERQLAEASFHNSNRAADMFEGLVGGEQQ